jgi:hypothetical protein
MQERGNVRSTGKSAKKSAAADISFLQDNKKLAGRYIKSGGKGLDELARILADEGYLSGKRGYGEYAGDPIEAQPSDLIAALERDGFDLYPEHIQEQIMDFNERASQVQQYADELGVDSSFTESRIMQALGDYSMAPPEKTPPLTRTDIPEDVMFSAGKANFERLLSEKGDMRIEMDNGRMVSLKDLAEELKDDEAAINALRVCAIG